MLKQKLTQELNALRVLASKPDTAEDVRQDAKVRVSVLQTVLGRADQKRNGPNAEISDDMVLSVLVPLTKDLKDLEVKLAGMAGKEADLQRTKIEVEVLSKYLPALASTEEIAAVVDAILAETPKEKQNQSLKGVVMKALTEKFGKGKFDGAAAGAYLNTKL